MADPPHGFITPRMGRLSEQSCLLEAALLTTQALRVQFLAVDPSAQFETGDPVTWVHPLVIRNELREHDGRTLTLRVAPRGELRLYPGR